MPMSVPTSTSHSCHALLSRSLPSFPSLLLPGFLVSSITLLITYQYPEPSVAFPPHYFFTTPMDKLGIFPLTIIMSQLYISILVFLLSDRQLPAHLYFYSTQQFFDFPQEHRSTDFITFSLYNLNLLLCVFLLIQLTFCDMLLQYHY